VAREEIKLAFAIDGKMIERAVSVGDQVRAGQLLARLDPENEQNSLSLSEAEVSGADASLTQAHNNESRIRKAGGATNEQLEQAIQQTKAAQAQRDGAGVRLKMAQDRLRYTELRRDVAGVVIAKGAEPNEIVRAGQPIVVLARNDWKDALFQIPPQLAFLRDVTAETLIEVSLSEDPSVAVKGRVGEVAPQPDPTTRTIPARVVLNNPPPEMRLGSTVTGRALLTPNWVIEIPGSALTEWKGLPAVWIVDASEKTVSLRPVRVARYRPETVIISQGLGEDEIVVTAGVQALRPGQKVRLLGPP